MSILWVRRVLTLLTLLIATNVVSFSQADEPEYRAFWSKSAAHDYLRERADWWLEWKEAQKQNGTVCLSCHTSVPFLVARTTLGSDIPAAQDKAALRLLASVKKRVTDWDSILPYTSTSVEAARGSESVMNAFTLANEDARLGARRPSEETLKAFANLWNHQAIEGRLRGAWHWYDYSLAPWEAKSESFGAALAAVAVGTAPGYISDLKNQDQQHVEMLREYLQSNLSKQNLHHRLMAVWASTKLPGVLTLDQQQQVIREAIAKQNGGGGWSAASLGEWKYRGNETPPIASDCYGTAFVVATLKSVAKGEQREAIERGLTWLRKHQRADDGSWTAESLNTEHPADAGEYLFMRDAATGWAILALE